MLKQTKYVVLPIMRINLFFTDYHISLPDTDAEEAFLKSVAAVQNKIMTFQLQSSSFQHVSYHSCLPPLRICR